MWCMKRDTQDGRRSRHTGRRQQLLDAAVDYVFAHGLSALSIRPVAEALGISHRTLLYHFGSKEELIVAVLKEVRERERFFFTFLTHDQKTESLPTFITTVGEHFATAEYEQYFRLFFEVYGLALQQPAVYHDFLQGVVTDWLPIFEQVLVRYGYQQDRAVPMSTLFLGLVRGLQLDALATHDSTRIQQAYEFLFRALSHLLAESEQRIEPSPDNPV